MKAKLVINELGKQQIVYSNGSEYCGFPQTIVQLNQCDNVIVGGITESGSYEVSIDNKVYFIIKYPVKQNEFIGYILIVSDK